MTKTAGFIASFLILSLLFLAENSSAKVFIGKDEALKLAFPNADALEKKSYLLTAGQIDEIEKLSRTKLDSKLFLFYVAMKDGTPIGYAAIDTHTVRTKTQTIMVVINPDGSLKYTEVLAFYEPIEYKATQNWIDLYKDKSLKDGLKVGYDIPNITGATLTSNSTANAVKKILAVFEVAVQRGAENN